jgi:dATP pyrophosphohydrolase
MLKQLSSGVIVYRFDNIGKRMYLLLQYHGKYWDFPKGKLEAEEKWIEAAIRETREETGIQNLEIEPNFEYSYSYTFSDYRSHKVEKTVVFFIGKADSDVEVTLSHEHVDYLWLSYEQARMQVYFPSVKVLLDEVENFLIKKNS